MGLVRVIVGVAAGLPPSLDELPFCFLTFSVSSLTCPSRSLLGEERRRSTVNRRFREVTKLTTSGTGRVFSPRRSLIWVFNAVERIQRMP